MDFWHHIGLVMLIGAASASASSAASSGSDGPWEGWATTTQFGSGDGPWGDDPTKQVYITALNNESVNRMGAAVPWRFFFKWYGSKAGETSTVYDSIVGKNDVKACFLMQPIVVGPSSITGTIDGAPVTCTGTSCIDINDDHLAATYSEGGVTTTFPSYLIVPFEGCGGDCKPVPAGPGPDCMNSCAVGSDFVAAINGDFSHTTGDACSAMRVLCGGSSQLVTGTPCTWPWNSTVETNFQKLSRPIGCTPETSWCIQAGKLGSHVNWCSGQNMHFDIGMDRPYFVKPGSNAIITTDPANIVVRYKKVSCAVHGVFDPVDHCIQGAVDCGNGVCQTGSGLCVCNPGWTGAHCDVSALCQGVTCPANSKCDSSTGLCVVNVPPSLDGCKASHWSCLDPTMPAALASWCSALLAQTTPSLCTLQCSSSGDMASCATCLLKTYGLSSTCSWSSGTANTNTSVSNVPATTQTAVSTVSSTTPKSSVIVTSTIGATTSISSPSSSPSSAVPATSLVRGSCTRNNVCTANPWCNDPAYLTWCPQQGSNCPTPMCVWTAGTTEVTVVASSSATTTTLTSTIVSSSIASTIPSTSITSTIGATSQMPMTSGCTRNDDCNANPWCNSSSYLSWCSQQGKSCPAPMCVSIAGTTGVTVVASSSTTTTRLQSTTVSSSVVSTILPTTTVANIITSNSEAPASSSITQSGNPQPVQNMSNVVIDAATLACADPKWKPDSTGLWTFGQIAAAFLEYGVAKFYKPSTGPDALSQCTAALYIAAGECQETAATLGKGCNAPLTGPSGVFQLDFMRTASTGNKVNPQITSDGNIMNLCLSGFGAGYLTATPYVDETHVATLEGDSFTTCMQAPALVNAYGCPDPQATAGVNYSNYIGTFCHKGYLNRWSPCTGGTAAGCCGIWNGGANSYQVPFPTYYFQKAQAHLDNGANFTATCQAAIMNSRFQFV